jgi:hypothetical protein
VIPLWRRLQPARVLAPILAIGLACCIFMGIYNHAVTGSVTTFPYQVYERQYAQAPGFWLLPAAARRCSRPPCMCGSLMHNHGLFATFFPRHTTPTPPSRYKNRVCAPRRGVLNLAQREVMSATMSGVYQAAFVRCDLQVRLDREGESC